MTIPRLTAEYSIGPTLHTYLGTGPGTTPDTVAPMGLLDGLGGIFGGVLSKVPCLIGCGLPNAVSLVGQCGLDPSCYIERAPSAVAGCIRQCLQ
ncbi:hypothetical protein [Actinomadura violacea]|uniref:Hydrophobin n=1 Tax=Actinomadura violacea TaxID=2819934 RepID=A0ABS3SA51_9ACTN|nr:hypothetical protein [Actinomadura violacea]MBO2465443.1 hypothetical protein [Actinomadura violacea]